MAPSYVFGFALLSLSACFCVCSEQSGRISDLRRCVDADCKGVISYAKTLIKYVGDHPKLLSFNANLDVVVFSKSAGSKPNLWGGEIQGRRGYFPQNFVREYKVLVQNPLQVVPTEGDSVPEKVEERRPNETSSEVGDLTSNSNVSNGENVIPDAGSRPEKTAGNKSSIETEESEKVEKRPLTRGLLSLDSRQEMVSVPEAADQLPSSLPETPTGSRFQDDAAKAAAAEEGEEEEDGVEDDVDDDDEAVAEEASESKSFIVVDGTRVELDEAHEETPTLAVTTLGPTRTSEEYAAPTVSVTPAPAAKTVQGAISATSSSAFNAQEKVTAESGEVEYGAGIAAKGEEEDVTKEEEEKEEEDAWSFETKSGKEVEVVAASEEEDAKTEVLKTESEKKEEVAVEEVQVVAAAREDEYGGGAEAKKGFSEELVGRNAEVLKVNEKKEIIHESPAPTTASLREPNVSKEESREDGTTVDGSDAAGATIDTEQGQGSVTHPEENLPDLEADPEMDASAVDGAQVAIASVLNSTRESPSESLLPDVNGEENDGNADTVQQVEEKYENEDADADNVTEVSTEPGSEDVAKDLDVDVDVLREKEQGQESEEGERVTEQPMEIEDLIDTETVTPYASDEDVDGGHCVDCEGPVTQSGPLEEEQEEEDWRERWRGLDAKEAAKSYVEVIGTYTQIVIDLLPEPVYVILSDLQERAVSPRVVVFTFIVGFFTFLVGLTYFALHYKIRGSGTLLAAKLNTLDRKLFTVMTEKDSLHEVVSVAERKIKILEDELQAAVGNAQAARKELRTCQSERDALKVNAASLEENLETAVETGLEVNRMLYEFLTSQSDNVRLQKALDSLESELNLQKAAALDLNEGARDAVQANLQLKQLLEDSRAEVASLQEQNSNLLADAMSAETTKESLELRLTNQNEELDELRNGSEQLLKEAAEWDASVKSLQSRVDALTEENVETKGVLASKKKELESLEELVTQMKPTEGDVSNEDILAKVLDAARLKTELKSAMAENDTLQSKLKFEASVKEQLEEQLFSVAAETERARKECAAAVRAKEDAEQRLQVLSNYFKEKETELQKELGLQEAKRQQTQETALTSNQKAALYEQEVSLYRSQIEGLKKEIEEQERSFKVQVADQEKKAHNNWLAARNAERRLEEVKRESSMLRNKLTSLDQDKDAQTRSNPDGTTLQQNSSRLYSETLTSPSPNPASMTGGPVEPVPPPSSGPSSLYHEPIDLRRIPVPAFLPPDRPLPPPHFLGNRMMGPFGPMGPMGPMYPGPPPPPPHLFDRRMPSPPPEYRFGPPPPPPPQSLPLFPIARRRTPPHQQQQPFEPLRNRTPSPTRMSPFDARSSSSSAAARQWVPNLDSRREPVASSNRQDLIHDPRTSSPLTSTSQLNTSAHSGRNAAV